MAVLTGILFVAAAVAALAAAAVADPPQITAVDRAVVIDGVLEEWGVPKPLHIRAGDGPVGVRGGFNGASDHFAEVYLMWSAESLYVAVVVQDDIQDVARIPPEDVVWKGPNGERRDKMYYFDHLKVFVRAPRANLGYNIWVAPADASTAELETMSGPAYAWGSQQRSPGSLDVPVRVGSAISPGLYTYELAIPWEWLQVHPVEGMKFDSMFLLPDSDRPKLSLENKVGQSNKWIWWKEKIQLTGTPPGWKPPPESIVDQVEKRIAEFVETIPIIEEKEEPVEDPEPVLSLPGPEASTDTAAEELTLVSPSSEAAPPQASPFLPDLEQVERQLNRRPTAPAFIAEVTDQATPGQARALFRSMAGAMQRMIRDRISGRIDVIATDAAEAAGTEKMVARAFAIGLFERVLRDVEEEESELRTGLGEVAAKHGLTEKQVVRLVQHSARSVLKWFEKNNLYGLSGVRNVPTTGKVLKRSSGKAKLSVDEARQVLAECLDFWIL